MQYRGFQERRSLRRPSRRFNATKDPRWLGGIKKNNTEDFAMSKVPKLLGLGLLTLLSFSWQAANATEVRAIATGEIFNFVDPADVVGYGGTGEADGRRVTFYFTYETDSAPPDYYGGARFPREADYFTNGNSSTAPSWVSSYIEFDNGGTYRSDDYVGTQGTTDQVKIIERDGGSPYDYIGFYDAKVDSTRAFNLGVVVYEYVTNLVDGLSLEQFPTWTSSGGTFPSNPRGIFAFADYSEGWAFNGRVVIDSLTVLGEEQVVMIDIKPGSYPNSINPHSKGKIPVAVLYTESFDATQVDWDAVLFGPAGAAESHGRSHVEDVDGDGDMDLVLHFNTGETGITCGDTEATLTGETFDGRAITGTDSVATAHCPSLASATISALIGDKDCFGLGGVCSDGDHYFQDLGGTGADNREAGEPLGVDQFDTSVPLGGPSFSLELDLGGATPLSASLTTFTAGIDLVGATFLFNGTNIGFYVEADGLENRAATVVFNVPIALLTTQNTLTLSVPDLGLVQDGFIIDYVELIVETDAADL